MVPRVFRPVDLRDDASIRGEAPTEPMRRQAEKRLGSPPWRIVLQGSPGVLTSAISLFIRNPRQFPQIIGPAKLEFYRDHFVNNGATVSEIRVFWGTAVDFQ